MARLKFLTLVFLRVALGLAILVTFATIVGVGIGRQAALGGGFSEEVQRQFTDRTFVVWLQTGGPVALAALALAGMERWLARRWTRGPEGTQSGRGETDDAERH